MAGSGGKRMGGEMGGRWRNGPSSHIGGSRRRALAGLSIAAVAAAVLLMLVSPFIDAGSLSTDGTAFAQGGRGTPLPPPPSSPTTTRTATNTVPPVTPTSAVTATQTVTSTSVTPPDLTIAKGDNIPDHVT